MKAKTIGYWVTTVLTALLFASGGIMQVLRMPDAVTGIVSLGYPVYFVVLLGIWKILGAAAIVAPGFPRLKEWAYAGIVFDLTGAAVSHAASCAARSSSIPPVARSSRRSSSSRENGSRSAVACTSTRRPSAAITTFMSVSAEESST